MTLIKSHPEFKEKRAVFFSKEFNPAGKSAREIMAIIQKVDIVSDRLNEISGNKVATDQMYLKVLTLMGNRPETIGNEQLSNIKLRVHELFMENLPGLLNPSVNSMLSILNKEGYSMNISSNTGYIPGTTIIMTLKALRILNYFDFCIFSDEVGTSKPAASFYTQVYSHLKFEKNEVLHVGDNYKADYIGATKYGFKALHINNQTYTIDDIKKHL